MSTPLPPVTDPPGTDLPVDAPPDPLDRVATRMARLGFGDHQDPGRAVTLFRCAAALAEAGTPPAVVRGLLEEPALKTGLDPAEVEKQLAAGIEHGKRKGGSA